MTDALRIVSENTAVPAASFSDGKLGKSMSLRWAEPDKPPQKEESRTAEEIIEHISKRLEEVE